MAMWLGELCHISPLAVFVSTKYQKKKHVAENSLVSCNNAVTSHHRLILLSCQSVKDDFYPSCQLAFKIKLVIYLVFSYLSLYELIMPFKTHFHMYLN